MTAEATTQERDVIEVIRSQHEEIKALFARIESAEPSQREDPFCDLRRLLAVHETAEEEVVHPALRRIGDEGQQVAEARIQEESTAKDKLAALEDLDSSSPQFLADLRTFRDAVVAHAEQEEQQELPLLQQNQSEERLRAMGRAFSLAEQAAPTHPHPHGPDSATGNMVVGPFVAVADRVRDALQRSGS
jgi:hemerythrin superfamily protein